MAHNLRVTSKLAHSLLKPYLSASSKRMHSTDIYMRKQKSEEDGKETSPSVNLKEDMQVYYNNVIFVKGRVISRCNISYHKDGSPRLCNFALRHIEGGQNVRRVVFTGNYALAVKALNELRIGTEVEVTGNLSSSRHNYYRIRLMHFKVMGQNKDFTTAQ